MKNREMNCRYGLSLVHWLRYAASRGWKERNLLDGW
jgi:hypothetical protein